jgi:hypothetical protein
MWMAARFAAVGKSAECASESVLAWTMLAVVWPAASAEADAVAGELVGQEPIAVSPEHHERARARAAAQAMDLQAHFVMVGRTDEASLYETVAEHLGTSVASLDQG